MMCWIVSPEISLSSRGVSKEAIDFFTFGWKILNIEWVIVRKLSEKRNFMNLLVNKVIKEKNRQEKGNALRFCVGL